MPFMHDVVWSVVWNLVFSAAGRKSFTVSCLHLQVEICCRTFARSCV